MADLVAKLTGDDKLTPVLSKVKKELQDTGKQASKLNDIQAKFDRISNSSAPLKKKLADVKKLLAEMNMDGLTGDELFSRMAEQAGAYADALGDASTAVKVFSDDNMKLQAAAQGMQLVAGCASTLTGVMGMLGVEDEKTQQAILKVQSAMSILNGVQAVANLLNKDSALMLRLKQIRMTALTASTTANTVAEGANAAATGASTIAKNAWNIATAIGKALLGDFSGLVLVGAAALATYAICTSDSTKKQEENNDAITTSKKLYEDYGSAVADESGKMVGKFMLLKSQWEKLKDTASKTKWLEDNQTEIGNLGLKVDDLTTAEDVFVNNSSKVVRALELRAKAMAAQNLIMEAYSAYYKNVLSLDNVAGGKYYNKLKVGDADAKSGNYFKDEWRSAGVSEGDYTMKESGKNTPYYHASYELNEAGVAKVNQYRNNQALALYKSNVAKFDSELQKQIGFANNEIAAAEQALADLGLGDVYSSTGKNKPTTTKPTNTPKKEEKKPLVEADDDSTLKFAQDILKQFQDLTATINIDDKEALAQNEKDIEKWKQEVERRQIILNSVVAVDEESLQYAQAQLERFSQEQLQFGATMSPEELKKNQEQIDHWREEVERRKTLLGIEVQDPTQTLEFAQEALRRTMAKHITIPITETEELQKSAAEIEKWKREVERRKLIIYPDVELSAGSLEYAEDMLSKAKKALESVDINLVSEEELRQAQERIKEWEKVVESREIALGIKVPEVKPSIEKPQTVDFKQGSVDDLRQSLSNARSIIEQIKSDTKDGLITTDEARQQIDALNEKLQEIGLEPIELTIKDDGTIQTSVEALEEAQQRVESMMGAVDSFGAAFQTLGGAIDGTTGSVLQFAGQTLQAIAQILPQLAALIGGSFAAAMAKGTEAATGLGWPACIPAIASIIATITGVAASAMAMKKKFADGGIVKGTTHHGDTILAGLNAGEMVLNKGQQANLFNLLKNGGGNGRSGGQVEFKISGSTLKGVLNNYDRKTNRLD